MKSSWKKRKRLSMDWRGSEAEDWLREQEFRECGPDGAKLEGLSLFLSLLRRAAPTLRGKRLKFTWEPGGSPF